MGVVNRLTLDHTGCMLAELDVAGYVVFVFNHYNQLPRPTQPGRPLWVCAMSTVNAHETASSVL